jgi:hypothetical protein
MRFAKGDNQERSCGDVGEKRRLVKQDTSRGDQAEDLQA